MLSNFLRRWFGASGDPPPRADKQERPRDAAAATTELATPAIITARFYDSLMPAAPAGHAVSGAAQRPALDTVRQSLSQPQALARVAPHLPAVIPRLLRSLRDSGASARDYVAIIHEDPALSAAVLRLANSAHFNPLEKPVDNTATAVVKLGTSGLRTVLSAAVMQPIIQRRCRYFSQFGEKLWRHSLACALACQLIAPRHQVEPFIAYLTGLLHDVGKITVFSELCKAYALIDDAEALGRDAFVPLMQDISAQLSYQIARAWEMPESICSALREQIDVQSPQRLSACGLILYQANLVTEVFAATELHPPASLENLCRAWGLPPGLVDALGRVSTDI